MFVVSGGTAAMPVKRAATVYTVRGELREYCSGQNMYVLWDE